MRQVPHFLIIGNGRLATHFKEYFSLLSLSYSVWHRAHSLKDLAQKIESATHVLLMIKDDAIDSFIQTHQALLNDIPYLIHFSGQLISSYAFGMHPLMTFNTQVYDLSVYQSIPFVIDEYAPDFNQLLPGLPNLYVRLPADLKSKYHALCVLSGNFSCLLWQKLFDCFEQQFSFPKELAHPYLMQQMKNMMVNPMSAFTGPLARGDHQTIEKNMQALVGDPYQEVYKSFVTCYEKTKRN